MDDTAQLTAIPKYVNARNALGLAIRRRRPEPEISALRSVERAARLADLIERTLADGPPLQPEHVPALHRLLDAAIESRQA